MGIQRVKLGTAGALVAHCASYGIDTSNIRYTIDNQCEDAPCFKLLRPASPRRNKYTALELIALLRTLRYNESFRSISFSGVSLDALQSLRDPNGNDKDAHLTRADAQIHVPGQENLSVLSQEIRALSLKSKWLRRMDFSYTLSRTPKSDSESHDPGCGIPEAIFPICRRELTNVDWVVLNGIKLGDSDLDYLVDAASQRGSHFRALEVGNCGLSLHDIDLLLSTTVAQDSTLEALNISGVQGRLKPDMLQQAQFKEFSSQIAQLLRMHPCQRFFRLVEDLVQSTHPSTTSPNDQASGDISTPGWADTNLTIDAQFEDLFGYWAGDWMDQSVQ